MQTLKENPNSVISGVFTNAALQKPANTNTRTVQETEKDRITSAQEQEGLRLMPGTAGIKARVENLLSQGHIYKAVEVLQDSLHGAENINLQLMDLAANTMDWLKENYAYETTLIDTLHTAIHDHYYSFSHDFSVMGIAIQDIEWVIANDSSFTDLFSPHELSGDGLEALLAPFKVKREPEKGSFDPKSDPQNTGDTGNLSRFVRAQLAEQESRFAPKPPNPYERDMARQRWPERSILTERPQQPAIFQYPAPRPAA